MRRNLALILVVLAMMLSTIGCGAGIQHRTLQGMAVGGASGAVIGAGVAGGKGALIGAGAGTLAGALWGATFGGDEEYGPEWRGYPYRPWYQGRRRGYYSRGYYGNHDYYGGYDYGYSLRFQCPALDRECNEELGRQRGVARALAEQSQGAATRAEQQAYCEAGGLECQKPSANAPLPRQGGY